MSDIRITFVLPEDIENESEASEIMKQAYESCSALIDNIFWIKESKLNSTKFTKLDYVVFENFENKDFSKLLKMKCARIVGPLAVSVCLMEGKPIPNFPWPILNVAMYNCVVTCSQMTKSHKEEIKNKVGLMGGLYTGDFLGNVTHIVCDGTTSDKYMLAVENKINVMLPSWVNYVFNLSQSKNVNANDSNILKRHKCPPFHKLIICTTGISGKREKDKLQSIIVANGGQMVGKLNLNQTHVLVCYGEEVNNSEKFKAAKARLLPCVTIDWVFDSAEKGFSLPYKNYDVKTVTSTPTKGSENMNPNFSTISCIGVPAITQSSIINETKNVSENSVLHSSRDSKKRKASDSDLVKEIDIKKVKNAGNFLDGCSVFVAGFNAEQREKLNKIVNLSGATRYDDLSERVTHVIAGDVSDPEVQAAYTVGHPCAVVSIQWILRSMEQQSPADEEEFLISKGHSENAKEASVSSPVSKKALNILKKAKLDTQDNSTFSSVSEREAEKDDALTQQYLKHTNSEKEEDTLAMLLVNAQLPGSKTVGAEEERDISLRARVVKKTGNLTDKDDTMKFEPHETSTQITGNTLNSGMGSEFFNSYKFLLAGFDEQNAEILKEYIEDAGGIVVDKHYKDIIDYGVIPMLNNLDAVKTGNIKVTVNELFIMECTDQEALIDILYYHTPMDLPDTEPLVNCVVTVSIYTAQERHFLKSIIEGLGGTFQEQFSRKNIPAKNVLASTHLVSPEPSGKKYEAALKWNLPVINKDWLMECAKTGSKADIHKYLVGESQPPSISNAKSDNESSKEEDNVEQKPADVNACNSLRVNEVYPIDDNRKSAVDMGTPTNQIYKNVRDETPETYSQVTPINKILQDAIANKILPTPSPKIYYPWDPKTPDTPLGAFIRENPSPRLRKEMQKYVNSFPEFVPPKKRLSTPLSELRRRLRDKVLGKGEYTLSQTAAESQTQCRVDISLQEKELQNEVFENASKKPTENVEANQKLQKLQEMVMASGSNSASKRPSRLFEAAKDPDNSNGTGTNNEIHSQVCTVDWDYGQSETQTQAPKIFMISGLDLFQREQLEDEIKALGGTVSESPNFNPASTHLICPKPGRNEKTLASMASGKWILHVSFIQQSKEAGKFLNEEEFEFGNVKSRQNVPYDEKDNCVQFWRKEIKKRGYGAFNGMRAIVVAEKRDPLIKVIEAGEGVVLNINPPFDDPVHATHCLLETKLANNFSKYIPLALQGIKCINTIYINDFLRRTGKEDNDYILPYFTNYYGEK